MRNHQLNERFQQNLINRGGVLLQYQDQGSVRCPHCGEWVAVEIDPSAGRRQQFVEDCWVCCRPMEIRVNLEDGEEYSLAADPA